MQGSQVRLTEIARIGHDDGRLAAGRLDDGFHHRDQLVDVRGRTAGPRGDDHSVFARRRLGVVAVLNRPLAGHHHVRIGVREALLAARLQRLATLRFELFSDRPELLASLLTALQLSGEPSVAILVAVFVLFRVVHLIHLGQDPRHLTGFLGLGLHQPRMAHRLVARRVGSDLRSVDRYATELRQPRGPSAPHCLPEQLGKVLSVTHTKPVQGPEVRHQAAGQVPEAQVPAQASRDLATAVHPLDRAEQPQLEQHAGRVRTLAPHLIAVFEHGQIQALHPIIDEEHRVTRIQRVAQVRGESP